MNKLAKAAALTSIFALGACGERATVPSASVGMVFGPNGFVGDVIDPSTFRLKPCFLWTVACERLVVIEAGDAGMSERMDVLLPSDNLIVNFDVRFTLGLSNDADTLRGVFGRVRPTDVSTTQTTILMQQVYEVYGQAVVRNVVRSKLSEYSMSEIAANQAAVSVALRQVVEAELSDTPFVVKQFGLASIQFPDIVRDAMEATAERTIAIERAEADAQVRIREAQAALEVARAEREAELLQAETIAEANRILAAGVTPDLLEYRRLQVLESLGGNENVVFFPVEMVASEAMQTRMALTGPDN